MDKLKGSIKPFSVYHTDAYMIAVKNGFEGTEAEWLKSLKLSPEEVDSAVAKYLEENPVAIDKTLTKEGQAADAKATGEEIRKISAEAVNGHIKNKENPHNVTALQVGLGNVNNTSDMDKPVSTAQSNAIAEAKNEAITVANGKATTVTFKGTLLASGWSNSAPFTQTVSIPGMLSTDYPFVDIDLSDVADAQSVIESWNMVGRVTVSGDNRITGYCYEEKPTVNIPIFFKVVR